MNHRDLGSTGYEVSEIGLGTWQIGSDWGDVSDEEGKQAIRAALDAGVTFLDTADVYGDGRSERHIASVLDEREAREDVIVATKAGRRLDPHEAAGYDYVAQLWFESPREMNESFESDAGAEVQEDAATFLDMDETVMIPAADETTHYESE